MHAYLIVSRGEEEVEREIVKTLKLLKSTPLDFELAKIADARELNSFTNLLRDKPTSIVIRNIDSSTTETLNAFLKNLEEPQENISYILTARSINGILPTIISRCQIVNLKSSDKDIDTDVAIKYLASNVGKRLLLVSEIKERDEAIKFIENIIDGGHIILHTNKVDYKNTSVVLESADSTLKALKYNGNVNLQLTNFVVNSQ